MGHVMRQVFLAACIVTLYLASDGAIDRKDRSNVTSPLMALLAPLTSPVPGPYYSCPSDCKCLSLTEDYSVTCHGGRIDDVIRTLPVETTKLKYTVSRFKESNIEFTHLSRLTSLELTNDDLTRYEDSDVITRGDIFRGLGELRQLRIHLNLKYINETALTPLTALTTLDLSHTRSLDKGNIRKLLVTIRDLQIPLNHLSIRNFQHQYTSAIPRVVNFREDIVRHLQGVPLTELDISGNGVIIWSPGLVEFLPGLKVFRTLENEGQTGQTVWLCFILDLYFHPSLKYVSISRLALGPMGLKRFKRLLIDISGKDNPCFQPQSWTPFMNKSDTHAACSMVSCLCSRYTDFPCQVVPKLGNLFNTSGTDCEAQRVYPVPPSLEVIQLINESYKLFGNLVTGKTRVTLCWQNPNKLRYVDLSYTASGPPIDFIYPIVKGLNEVWYFNLQGSGGHILLAKFAKALPTLSHLLIGGNYIDIEDSEINALENNPKLVSLDMANCKLTSLAKIGISSLPLLQTLNISRSNLLRFDLNISQQVKLTLLNISWNQLTSLPAHVTSALDAFSEDHSVSVDLSGNPLRCDCNDLNFFMWLLNTRVNLLSNDSVQCEHPMTPGLSVSVWSITPEEMNDYCFPSHWRVILSVVLAFCAILCLAITGYVIYRKRWSIRFYLHAARRSWNRSALKSDEQDLHYDAFVVYSAEDRRWVHDVLLTTLEEEHQLRLCIHFRDFIPGHDIEDTIVESIEKSRKTILIMSPNFLQSDWCHFEFKMARQKIVLEGRDVLILVILEELPTSGLSWTLVRLLQKKTYLKWTESEAGQQLFWQQLVDAIKEDPANDP